MSSLHDNRMFWVSFTFSHQNFRDIPKNQFFSSISGKNKKKLLKVFKKLFKVKFWNISSSLIYSIIFKFILKNWKCKAWIIRLHKIISLVYWKCLIDIINAWKVFTYSKRRYQRIHSKTENYIHFIIQKHVLEANIF